MGSKWRKAKLVLGLNTCLYAPQTQDGEEQKPSPSRQSHSTQHRHSDAVLPSSVSPRSDGPSTPTPSSSGLRLAKSGHSKPTKSTCAICLTSLKPGQGHAIFTAECSHSFHFHCITSSVKHGNQVCPICRAKWKEVPFQNPASSDAPHGRSRINPAGVSRDDAWMSIVRQLPPPHLDASRQVTSIFQTTEPPIFNDDEVSDQQNEVTKDSDMSSEDAATENRPSGTIMVKTYPEVSAVPRAVCHNNFNILIHLKAPSRSGRHNSLGDQSSASENSRAPVDLVTVLDVSGSMAGTKLALLKRAMGFVIQNLGPSDRLSVIAFSSTARRLFPLRRMTETGRHEALQAINSLIANGGTNIAEGLKKGAKVLLERSLKNPIGSIILLSDGQDTYTISSPAGTNRRIDYKSLLPSSIHRESGTGCQIPVHAFGFGSDHDSISMHSISEISGGTFSFIEAEGVIQDAFAQCIGGLLSVVVQEVRVKVECMAPNLHISSIKAGSYRSHVLEDGILGSIDVGDLYAEEERDFLVTVDIPANDSIEMPLIKVDCSFRDPITKEMVLLDEPSEVKIQRPIITGELVVSMEVDRQRNRLRAAEAMAEARAAAEHGDLSNAVSVLESCRRALSETVSARAGDRLYVSLCAELKEMQERMANRRIYESSGRAYVLSGLSSHSWQRATARGDSTDSTSLVQAYQTPSMVDMVTRSQTMILGPPPPRQRKLRQALSFPAQPEPR